MRYKVISSDKKFTLVKKVFNSYNQAVRFISCDVQQFQKGGFYRVFNQCNDGGRWRADFIDRCKRIRTIWWEIKEVR